MSKKNKDRNRIELGESGIRVNSVSAGPIPTGIFGKSAGMNPADADRTAGCWAVRPLDRLAVRRPGQAVCFLTYGYGHSAIRARLVSSSYFVDTNYPRALDPGIA